MVDEEAKLAEIRAQVEARTGEEFVTYPPREEKNTKPSSHCVRECLEHEEYGLGLLLSDLLRARFKWDNTRERWFKFEGHSWHIDIMNEVVTAVNDLADQLAGEWAKVQEEIRAAASRNDEQAIKNLRYIERLLYKKIKFLKTERGIVATLKRARTCANPIAIKGDEWDQKPDSLACLNGVIDQRIWELYPGKPENLISRTAPVEWHGLNIPAPRWEGFIHEIFNANSELISFVQRLLGYCTTGWNREHFIAIFHGEGRNGKSTLVEVLRYVLGPLAAPIQAEMLLDQGRTRNSAGPSPDIMALRGLRIAFASESDENRMFSASRVKWLSGGDTILGRDVLGKDQLYWVPTHKLILLSNFLPNAAGHDFAFWERCLVIPFDLSFVDRKPTTPNERRAKKGLVDELKEEASGILAWLAKGCLDYQRLGLDPPRDVLESTAEYRRSQDIIGDYIADRLELGDQFVTSATTVYDDFKDWFKENISEKTTMKQKTFGTLLGKRFKRKTVEGLTQYVGFKIR